MAAAASAAWATWRRDARSFVGRCGVGEGGGIMTGVVVLVVFVVPVVVAGADADRSWDEERTIGTGEAPDTNNRHTGLPTAVLRVPFLSFPRHGTARHGKIQQHSITSPLWR